MIIMRFKTKTMGIELNKVKRTLQCFFPVLVAAVVLFWQVGCTLVADFSDPKRTDGGGILDADPDDDGSIHDGSIYDGGTEDGDISTECGNSIREGNEICDGTDLNEANCQSQGYGGGTLTCEDDCNGFDTSECWTCGDGDCREDDGENFNVCPEDCGIIDISTGEIHACAVNYDGTLWCWGNNEKGQLGNQDAGTTNSSPVMVQGLDGISVKQVSAGESHTCAVTEAGALYCWGLNANGQVGNNSTATPVQIPVVIGLSEQVVQVSAGGYHTCAVVEGGVLYCWGLNEDGQVGNNDAQESFDSPQAVSAVSEIQQVAAGKAHTCAINQMSQLYCWGNNQSKQVGKDSDVEYYSPQMVGHPEDQNADEVSAGDKHTCAINNTGELVCWGDNEFGQLGSTDVPAVPGYTHTPTQVTDFDSNVQLVSCGFDHTCGVKSGELYCWGSNASGQLGIGEGEGSVYENVPRQLLGFSSSVQKLSSGMQFTCMVSDGVPYCWGDNTNGKLGVGESSGIYDEPEVVNWPPNSEE